MKMRLYTPIALLLFAGLGATGCAESMDDAPEMHQSSQELVLLSVQEDTPESQAMNLVYNQERGWHLSFSPILKETNFAGMENVSIRNQSLDIDIDTPAEEEETPGGQATAPSSRFSASLAGQSRYSASVPGSTRFSSSVPGSSSFSSGLPTSYNFSNSLSTGGSCSLSGLCDFVELMCSVAPDGVDGCGGGAVAQCRSTMRQVAAEIEPEARPFVCALGNFFTCASSALMSGGDPDANLEVCVGSEPGAGFLFIFLVAAALGA